MALDVPWSGSGSPSAVCRDATGFSAILGCPWLVPRVPRTQKWGRLQRFATTLAAQEQPAVLPCLPAPPGQLSAFTTSCRLRLQQAHARAGTLLSFPWCGELQGPRAELPWLPAVSSQDTLSMENSSIPARVPFLVSVPQPGCPQHCHCRVKPSSSFPGFSRLVMPGSSMLPFVWLPEEKNPEKGTSLKGGCSVALALTLLL